MSECIKWESVIPNFQQGDVITPFGSKFKRAREDDYCIDGGVDHHDILEACASVRRKDSQQVGVYNPNGKQLIPEEFDKCELVIYNSGDFYVTAIKVQKDGLYGLYNKNGKMIVPAQFIDIDVRDYFIVVRDKNDLCGAYLTNGSKIIECEYDTIEAGGSLDKGFGYAIISQKGLFGVKLETGNEIVPIKFDYIEKISDGYIVYDMTSKATSLKGWYSRDGKSSIPCLFKTLSFQYEEILAETHEGLKGIYSYDGKEIVPPKFKSINYIGNFIVGLIDDNNLSVYDFQGTCLYCTTE